MNKFLIFIIAIGLAGGILFFSTSYKKDKTPAVIIRNHTFAVETADSNEKRTKGLGYRHQLAKDSGMLFIFDKAQLESFWMRGMEFPLDILFIRDDKIAIIYKNVPNLPADTPLKELPRYQSNVPVNYVLEINAGLSEKYGFQEGDKVVMKGL